MTYQRKTRDVFLVEQYTGHKYGWECVSQYDDRKSAQAARQEYKENQPEYKCRIRQVREKIET